MYIRKKKLKENQVPIDFREWRWGIAILGDCSEINIKGCEQKGWIDGSR